MNEKNSEIQNICIKISKFDINQKIVLNFEKSKSLRKNYKIKACLGFNIEKSNLSGFCVHSVNFDNGYLPKKTGINSRMNAKVFEIELN